MTADTETATEGPDIESLASAGRVTADIIVAVPSGMGGAATPCPDFDVDHLVSHLPG